jgi:hypothetical protein
MQASKFFLGHFGVCAFVYQVYSFILFGIAPFFC